MECRRYTLAECGMLNIWESNQSVSVNELKSKVHTKLKENFISKWLNELSTMSSCDVYVNFKTNFALEQYLIELSPHLRLSFCRFRLSNTRLPKVLGRFTNTPRDQRFCTISKSRLQFIVETHETTNMLSNWKQSWLNSDLLSQASKINNKYL